MKGKVVSMMLVVLLFCLAFPGCFSSGQNQIDELEQELQEDQTDKSDLQTELATAVENLEKSNALLDDANDLLDEASRELALLRDIEEDCKTILERNEILEDEVINLRQPSLDIKGRCVAGTIGYQDTVELLREFFPDAGGRKTSSYSREPFQLATLEILEEFLANDQTNTTRLSHVDRLERRGHDAVPFMMKEKWISEGLPPWSFCIVKVWREGMIGWWNVFLTKENGEYVFYGIDWTSDEIIKFAPGEYGGWDVCLIIVCDRIM